MKAVLVTGAGIVGCHTAQALLERSERVVLLDVNPDPRAIASVADIAGVAIETGDVTQPADLDRVVSAHDVERVIHTAAMMTGAARRSPQAAVAVNILGTTNVLELARTGRVGRVVLASSNSIQYGVFDTYRGGDLSEDLAMRMVTQAPKSLYTTTKLAIEFIAQNYHDWFGTDAVLLRYAAVLGRWGGPNNSLPARLLDAIARAGMTGEVAVLDDPMLLWRGIEEFVDPRDCATANVAALYAPNPTTRVYNVASGEQHTVEDVIAAARSVFPAFRVELKTEAKAGFAGFPFERPAISDLSAAGRELGWQPAHPLTDTIRHFACR